MPGIAATPQSAKGGVGKSAGVILLAGAASELGIPTLVLDLDPDRHLSNRFEMKKLPTGMGNVLDEAGLLDGEENAEAGAKRIQAEIRQTHWPHVDIVPAGQRLYAVSQQPIPNLWLLREIFELADVYERYGLILLDTAGRRGALASAAMYAAERVWSPVTPTDDAIEGALLAHERFLTVQSSHAGVAWIGAVLTNFDHRRIPAEAALRYDAYGQLRDHIRVEVPRRSAITESLMQPMTRLCDRSDTVSQQLAKLTRTWLQRDVLQLSGEEYPSGVLTLDRRGVASSTTVTEVLAELEASE